MNSSYNAKWVDDKNEDIAMYNEGTHRLDSEIKPPIRKKHLTRSSEEGRGEKCPGRFQNPRSGREEAVVSAGNSRLATEQIDGPVRRTCPCGLPRGHVAHSTWCWAQDEGDRTQQFWAGKAFMMVGTPETPCPYQRASPLGNWRDGKRMGAGGP